MPNFAALLGVKESSAIPVAFETELVQEQEEMNKNILYKEMNLYYAKIKNNSLLVQVSCSCFVWHVYNEHI